MFGSRELKFSKIRITIPEGSLIYLDGRSFRGTVDITKKDNMKLAVINRITLEEYLYGVLYNEVSHRCLPSPFPPNRVPFELVPQRELDWRLT